MIAFLADTRRLLLPAASHRSVALKASIYVKSPRAVLEKNANIFSNADKALQKE